MTFEDNKEITQDTNSDQKYKTILCKNWIKDKRCPFGIKCVFAHGEE